MSPPPPAGRPPGPHDDTLAKLLPTALQLFVDEGGQALTPTRLHQETGVSRATIYRNWPEPTDLIEVMLRSTAEPPAAGGVTGDLRADLHRAMDALIDWFHRRPARAFFAACLEYGRQHHRIDSTAREFVGEILEPFRLVIEAAVERGDLEGPVGDRVAEATGPAILRQVILGQDLSPAQGHSLVVRFLDGHGYSRR